MLDWSDGRYEETARDLAPVAEIVVDRAGITGAERVLDLGCGTGNVALLAARRGAEVTGIDPAPRLVDVARERLAAEGLRGTFLGAEAAALPFEDASFDAVLSVFAVIFAPDAEAAMKEMVRVLRPGGRIVLTSWVPAGPIAEAGRLVREALTRATAMATAASKPPAWGDPAFVRALFAAHGARADVEERAVGFEADSPEAWFEAQRRHHPVWRLAHRALASDAGAWEALTARTVDALRASNEAPARFRATSPYLLARASADRAG